MTTLLLDWPSADPLPARAAQVVISAVRPLAGEAFGLSFEISSSARAGGRALKSAGAAAGRERSLLARADDEGEYARWLAVSSFEQTASKSSLDL
eukprot:959606-Prymnesium_polylepis.1